MFALLCGALFAQGDLQVALTNCLRVPDLQRATVGVLVKDINGPVLFSEGGDRRLIPASALKLVTAAFALGSLGPDRKLTTSIWRDHGKVYLKGGGDPLLSIEELQSLGKKVGIQPGEVVYFDDSCLGNDRLNGAWEVGDTMRSDAPAVSGLTVNGGYADLITIGGKLKFSPRNFGMSIRRGQPTGDSSVRRSHGSWVVRVDGEIPSDDDEFATASLPDPALCAAQVVSGKAVRAKLGDAPASAFRVERTVAEILPALLKRSDNHAAETLLRMTGRALGGDGSWDSALAKEAAWLMRIGIERPKFRIADGSGLARYTEVTADALLRVLEWALAQKTGGLFADSMCAAGEGTLRNRLVSLNVRAKTGTLTGVCSLVGFVDAAGSRRLFAILFNHYEGSASTIRPIQDAVVARIASTEFRRAP
jgi:D-alanyl-D-alanine carboxypeptidase/D-alanyl-D-alanine-endopeptidase (penicillin-binding protein 4)